MNRDDYRKVAEGNAGFLLRELRRENGRLLRTWKSNPELGEGTGEAKLNGYLEDYAYLIGWPASPTISVMSTSHTRPWPRCRA